MCKSQIPYFFFGLNWLEDSIQVCVLNRMGLNWINAMRKLKIKCFLLYIDFPLTFCYSCTSTITSCIIWWLCVCVSVCVGRGWIDGNVVQTCSHLCYWMYLIFKHEFDFRQGRITFFDRNQKRNVFCESLVKRVVVLMRNCF